MGLCTLLTFDWAAPSVLLFLSKWTSKYLEMTTLFGDLLSEIVVHIWSWMFLEGIVLLSDFGNSDKSVLVHFLKPSFFVEQSSPQIVLHSIINLIDMYSAVIILFGTIKKQLNSYRCFKSTTHFLIKFSRTKSSQLSIRTCYIGIRSRDPSREPNRDICLFTTTFPGSFEF